MRYALFAVPFLATAYATTTNSYTLVPEISTSDGKVVTVTSTYSYSNPETSLLTETNSAGVVTGRLSNTAKAATSMPSVATIPAALPTGLNTLTLNVSAHLTSFVVSVGSSTTVLLGGGAVATDASLTTGPHNGMASGTASSGGNGGSGSGSGSGSGGSSGSSSSSTSKGAAPTNVKAGAAGIIGLGAFVAVLL